MAAGGKGANQAVSAARAGGDVTLFARVGADVFGERAIENFVVDGIDVACVIKDEGAATGTALIFIGDDGENCIGVAPGANRNVSEDDIYRFRESIQSADTLVIQIEIPMECVRAAVQIAAESGVRVILNPAPAAAVPPDILMNVDVLTPNMHETALLTGVQVRDELGAQRAAAILMAQGVGSVLITMGAQGAFLACQSYQGMIKGHSVKAVDATAAGDVFNGALAVAMCEGLPLPEAAVFANAAAALSVTKLGAQPSIPTRSDIEEFLLQRRPER